VDGAVFYRINDHLEAQLNVDNIFDERYFATAHSDNNITPGLPASVRLALHTRF
jgi:catecholate siderophore receptor